MPTRQFFGTPGKLSAEDKALDRFADLMIEKIQNLQQDWHKPWFTEGAMRWPRNMNGREYNGMNALMLTFHCEKEGYQHPIFCTFNKVAGLNTDANKKPLLDENGERLPMVSVNKGEKSFPVMLTSFTCAHKDTKEKIPYDEYKKHSDEAKKDYNVYPKLNVFHVFNIDQTNLKEARPELYQKLIDSLQVARPADFELDQSSFPAVDAMIDKGLWVCPIKPTHGDSAYYSLSKDEVVVPEKKQFKSGESFYSTLFHEMTHSTGSADRLNRLKDGATFGSEDYAKEELVAELGAALVSSRYSMTKGLKEDSAAYLKSWLDHIQESPDFLKSTLMDVKRASSMITQRVDNIQQQIDTYQQFTGREDIPDYFDVDNDGNTLEVAHSIDRVLEPAEEVCPFKRGR